MLLAGLIFLRRQDDILQPVTKKEVGVLGGYCTERSDGRSSITPSNPIVNRLLSSASFSETWKPRGPFQRIQTRTVTVEHDWRS